MKIYSCACVCFASVLCFWTYFLLQMRKWWWIQSRGPLLATARRTWPSWENVFWSTRSVSQNYQTLTFIKSHFWFLFLFFFTQNIYMTLLTLSFTSLSWKDTTNCHRTASTVCWALLQQVEYSSLSIAHKIIFWISRKHITKYYYNCVYN